MDKLGNWPEFNIKDLMYVDSLIERATSRVSPQIQSGKNKGCIETTYALTGSGYGAIGVKYNDGTDAVRLHHRVMYIVHNKVIPAGKLVRHTCDNPKCVNIEHLVLGSHQDNHDDMGFEPTALLSFEDADDIRHLYADGGISQAEIAKEYGVSREAVSKIIQNVHWHDPEWTYVNPWVSDEGVREIRRMYTSGMARWEIQDKTGLSKDGVGRIVNNTRHHDPEYTYIPRRDKYRPRNKK